MKTDTGLKARPDALTLQVKAEVATEAERLGHVVEETFSSPAAAHLFERDDRNYLRQHVSATIKVGGSGDAVGAAGYKGPCPTDFEALEAAFISLLATMEAPVVEGLQRGMVELAQSLEQRGALMGTPERVVSVLPLLVSPLLGQIGFCLKIVPLVARAVLSMPEGGRALLERFLSACPVDIVAARLVRPLQAFVTDRLKAMNALLSGPVIYALELLSLANAAEMTKPVEKRMPMQELYNDFVSENMDTLNHYKAWTNRPPGFRSRVREPSRGP